jgi:hypothetical protein
MTRSQYQALTGSYPPINGGVDPIDLPLEGKEDPEEEDPEEEDPEEENLEEEPTDGLDFGDDPYYDDFFYHEEYTPYTPSPEAQPREEYVPEDPTPPRVEVPNPEPSLPGSSQTLEEAFRRVSELVDRQNARVRPWTAVVESGDTTRRQLRVKTDFLRSHVAEWDGDQALHELFADRFRCLHENELEKAGNVEYKIEQGKKLLGLDGQFVDPTLFNPGFLDMYCHPPTPPRE